MSSKEFKLIDGIKNLAIIYTTNPNKQASKLSIISFFLILTIFSPSSNMIKLKTKNVTNYLKVKQI